MALPPGGRIILAFGVPGAPPAGDRVGLDFAPRPRQDPFYVGLSDQGGMGAPGVRFKSRLIQHATAGAGGGVGMPGIEKEAQRITAAGWLSGAVPAPTYVRWRRFITPASWAANDTPPVPSLRLAGGYQPAPGSHITLNFAEPLAPPPGSSVVLEFGAVGYGRVLGATVGMAGGVGEPGVFKPQQVRPAGIPSAAVVGAPFVEGSIRNVRPQGVATVAPSRPTVRNSAVPLRPAGFDAHAAGEPRVWNWCQYVPVGGFYAALFGTAYVQGGVKTVLLDGLASAAYGTVNVINTTANRSVAPRGIEPPGIPTPNVSPRFVLPQGLFAAGMGTPLVQPNPHPAGWGSALYGTPRIYYRTRFLRPAGIDAYAPGYPRVGDWAQRILHAASPVTAVFGDTAVRLKNLRTRPAGFTGMEVSPWAEVRNLNRWVRAAGIAPAAVGAPAGRNATPSFAPPGFIATRFGAAGVGARIRYVTPTGVTLPVAQVAGPSLWKTPDFKPDGIEAPAVPPPAVTNGRRYLLGQGAAMARHGTPTVGFAYRWIAPEGLAAFQPGVGRIDHGNRELLVAGFSDNAYGTGWASFARRALAPAGFRTIQGANHAVAGSRFLRPDGFVATRWGTRIIPEARVVYALGFAGMVGWPAVANRRQYLAPSSIRLYAEPQQHFGSARTWNLRQHVTMFPDVDSDLNPPRWSQWTRIENRNKLLGVTGTLMTRYGAVQVDNKARQILPAGTAAPALPGYQRAGMVAYRIRGLPLRGIEAPHLSTWANVRNAARLVHPPGLDAQAFGSAGAVNRTRVFNRIGNFDAAVLGYPFIAPRVRSLGIEARYTIAPPVVPVARVQLRSRYLGPRAIGNPEVGAAALTIHKSIITPRWTLQNFYGFPVVRNVTPEVRGKGYVMELWGDNRVRLQWRPLAPVGTNTALFGRTTIADRRRTIFLAGWSSMAVSDKLEVVRTGTPPLATQYIWLDSQDPSGDPEAGFGIKVPAEQVPVPSLQQQVVYPSGMDTVGNFGSPTVTANSIRVEPGYFDLLVGEPVVDFWRRTLTAKGIASTSTPGKPRLSPHTIWAVVDAPEQAVLNHPESRQELVRSEVTFGNPALENRHRIVAAAGTAPPAFGITDVVNRRQYLRPSGTHSARFGWLTVPGPIHVEFFTTISTMAMGQPTVARPPQLGPQTVMGQGFVAATLGQARLELFHRAMPVQGFEATAMGFSRRPDAPFMWQSLRVGERVPNVAEGFDAARFGATWISHRVRQVAVEGFDSFVMEYDYRAFALRMRVRNATGTERPRQIVLPRGDRMELVGTPGARLGVHYIRPDGNADQYRKGAPS